MARFIRRYDWAVDGSPAHARYTRVGDVPARVQVGMDVGNDSYHKLFKGMTRTGILMGRNRGAYLQEWRERNRERLRKYQQKYRDEHREQFKASQHRYYDKKKDIILVKNAKLTRTRYNSLKSIILDHYGSMCACCGERHLEFLVIDHVNGDGAKDRKMAGRGINFLRRIIALNFPKKYRILCANCNMATIGGKQCPHQKKTNGGAGAIPPPIKMGGLLAPTL